MGSIEAEFDKNILAMGEFLQNFLFFFMLQKLSKLRRILMNLSLMIGYEKKRDSVDFETEGLRKQMKQTERNNWHV